MSQLSHKVQEADITKRYGYPFYPRSVVDTAGNRIVVKDHHEHGRRIGKKVLEDATILQAPTLEEVIKAGYAPDVAERIVAQEQEKEAKGYKPYGDVEPPAPKPPAAAQEPQKSTVDELPEDVPAEAPPEAPAPVKSKNKAKGAQPDNWE